MKILTISGFLRSASANVLFLESLAQHFPEHTFNRFDLAPLPIFYPDKNMAPIPDSVQQFRKAIVESEAVLFCTPAYIFNIPGVLKNAMDWLASSGELNEKKVIAITYTPASPRGEKAMQSMLWSLQGLGAKVLVSLPLYQNELVVDEKGQWEGAESSEMIQEAMKLLIG